MGLALDELEKSTDRVIESDGIKILLDKKIEGYLETVPEIKVDYTKSRWGSGFIVEGGSGY